MRSGIRDTRFQAFWHRFRKNQITRIGDVMVLLGAFHVQTVMDSNTNNANDSFEQLLNQYLPINQHRFSSNRARPRFRAGAVRPRRSTTLQRGAELRGQYARILANFRKKRARKTKLTNRQPQSVQCLEISKSPEEVNRVGGRFGFRCTVGTYGRRYQSMPNETSTY